MDVRHGARLQQCDTLHFNRFWRNRRCGVETPTGQKCGLFGDFETCGKFEFKLFFTRFVDKQVKPWI